MKARKRLAAQSELNYLKVARRMRIAIQIADAMAEQRISKKELAKLMSRQPSEITKWLSGDQNFTSDTLTELSYYLHAKITGEIPDNSFVYINVSYSPSLSLDFPCVNFDVPYSVRRQWNQLSEEKLLVTGNVN